MRRIALLVVVAAVAALFGAGVAAATGALDHDPAPPSAAGATTEGITPAEAPNVRVAAWVDGTGPGTFELKRAKGVSLVTNPGDGQYCIRSNVSGFHPGRSVPVVTVDYSTSSLDQADAQWRSSKPDCPTGTIEVITFNTATGNLENDTAFTIVVP